MKKKYPPGPDNRHANIVNVIHYKINPLGFLTEIAEKYGDLVYFQMGEQEIYLLNHPDLVRQAFLKNWPRLKKPALTNRSNRGYWPDGLTSLQGESWRRQRRLMQPAFHQHRIAAYAQIIVNCTKDLINKWKVGDVINIDQEMLTLTARIAARILFDAEVEGFGSPSANKKRSGLIPFKEAMGEHFTVTENKESHIPSYITRLRAGPKMETTLAIIEERLASQEERGDMLSFFLHATYQDGSRMNREEIIGELLQMFFAGHHTLPTILIWLWIALSQNPTVESKMQAEVEQVLGERMPDHEALSGLSYGEMVIKETIRYYSPITIHLREVRDEFQLNSYTLKKGASIWVSPYLLHRDSRYFEEPERFLPERFSKENAQRIPKYAYLPFGAGPRICIANVLSMMQMNLIFATLAQSFSLTLVPRQVIVPKGILTMRPEKEVLMQVVARPKVSHPR